MEFKAAWLLMVRLKAYKFRAKEVGMDVIKEDQVLDCSGMLCPMPVVKTFKAIKAMEVGQILKMVATDPGAPPDMEAWSRQTGNELLRSMQEDGKFIFYIRRTK
jgi:tRNA 2-thiouridine synthesizing protein A